MRAVASAVVVAASVLVASGCAGSGPHPTTHYITPPETTGRLSIDSPRVQQIGLARASNPRVFAIFPAQPGRRKCLISEGGVQKKPLLLHAICTTSIRAAQTHEPALIVTFTEKWAWPTCPRGAYCPASARVVHHTWQVIEGEPVVTPTARLRVLGTRMSGAVAPQYYK